MTILDSSSRLKVKRDTFFLPDPKGGVYFRNNISSFRMEGSTIYQWIEKLMPLFNGERTMGELTEGLTTSYRTRVFEIGEILYSNGYIRDVSKDQPHQLNKLILEKYASQIEFIESFAESGAYRFERYRQTKVLVIGSGSILNSLVSSLIESGLIRFDFMISESASSDRPHLNGLIQNARKMDEESRIEELPFQEDRNFLSEAIKPYDWILYVTDNGNIRGVMEINQICMEEKKAFLPAIIIEQKGIAGPLLDSESDTTWESAWRRLHRTEIHSDKERQTLSVTSEAILANVLAFELFKKVTGIAESNQNSQIYLLDLDTLEGDWLSFFPHPLVQGKRLSMRFIDNLASIFKQEHNKQEADLDILDYFSRLTSEQTGIFHLWGEQNLIQLPLSQCLVQVVNPLSEGPAELLPIQIASGFTHEEAKREAGLKGIEQYTAKITDISNDWIKNTTNGFIGIGAGETAAEAVCRGLQSYLEEMLKNRKTDIEKNSFRLNLGTIEDRRCLYYLNSLTAINGTPSLGMEEDIFGFPVIWVKSNGRKYSNPGLNPTLALMNSLQQALFAEQNQERSNQQQMTEAPVFLTTRQSKLDVQSVEKTSPYELLQSSVRILTRMNKKLHVCDLSLEPFLKEIGGVFGVQIQEGES